MANVLGIDKALIGLIEGIAESTASLLKIVSGWIADRTGHFKRLVAIGYGLSSIGRPFFAFATSAWHVLFLRFIDRVGKGVRTAPRDAIIAATSPPELLGRAFGLHRAIDQSGAIVAPAVAMLVLTAFSGQFTAVFLAATVPGFIGLALIAPVQEAPRAAQLAQRPPRLRWGDFDFQLKLFLVTAGLFALGNSSNAFLLLCYRTWGCLRPSYRSHTWSTTWSTYSYPFLRASFRIGLGGLR